MWDQLEKLLSEEIIYIDDIHYIGIASDGIHTIIGMVGQEERVEAYLIDNPSPDDW